jgi:L-ascorbate metabolism protein UlaG (beta-lactamase superfamily)
MTEEQASQVLHAIRPRIFYPYHYGQVDHKTDLELLGRLIADLPDTEMRIRPME